MDVKQMDREYVANTYARFPLQITKGKGSVAEDETGKKYIDLCSGIAVNSFGFADDIWQNAVAAQAAKLQHVSNLYYTEPCAKLAEMLCRRTGMKKVFFSNSGTEANECAIKAARKYAAEKKGKEYYTILTLKNSFHGRTYAALSATGQDALHKDFQPLVPGFVYAEANNIEDLRAKAEENKLAGILFECVQGEGGVNVLEQAFVDEIARLGKERDILIMADEVQIGNGRSGKLYGYMNYGIEPDIVSTAKGLGGGLPIGATLFGGKAEFVLKPGDHGSTFGGNPICCAGAISILERLTPEFLDEVQRKSRLIFQKLQGKKGIRCLTGVGLLIGIETERPAADIINACMEQGVLTLGAHGKIRLLPALNIPDTLLEEALDVIIAVCGE
ncbi:MAG: acetylornithine/succinylornithine family transaminase [Anaerovoracaceae bacterium]|mgnify:CR=1 FL=1|nr:acetylornithine/succinylornithine family transaminase [Bacillota bacterium]MDY3954546.1 acetylornithine/succinylornithine family transaminase [Anaerovoracaceae bacterium]